jgi:2-succinyl-5-enolpyruvyl-6-hydroxy-3-cyclohexene-1-carboxylate synthase
MPIHFSTVNSIWASVLVETLHCLGLKTAVVCPGSRSAPLAVAFAQHNQIEAIPVLDERSAAFFALGLAKQTAYPTALICTSGTAGANFYPAIIEARESRVPLLVLTADRPPELRDCNAGQTVDQQKLYGSYPNWYSELAVPSLDLELLAYLRQTVIHAWERSLYPIPGCVHLNLPFRDPLAPIPQPAAQAFAAQFDENNFFIGIRNRQVMRGDRGAESFCPASPSSPFSPFIPSDWLLSRPGILIAGIAQPRSPQSYCASIAHLSKLLGLPVLAEGLSPLRNYADLNPYLISTYDVILRNAVWADKLTPDWVIRVGDMPTSKELRQWLARIQPRQWIIDPDDRNLDPLHGKTTHLRLSVEQVATCLSNQLVSPTMPTDYMKQWGEAEEQVRRSIDQTLSQLDEPFEGKVAWLLSQHLPLQTPIFVANSTPVRDVEWFWKPGHTAIQPYFNRGANGIDGTVSTALGMAHRQQSSVLLTGDLTLLHDTNGLLLKQRLVGHLTIVLINNNGGGIFEMLPIAPFDPPFEEFFATPQAIDFAQLCATYGVDYELIQNWEHLIQQLNPLPKAGIRVLEVRCDRKANARWRREFLSQASHPSSKL